MYIHIHMYILIYKLMYVQILVAPRLKYAFSRKRGLFRQGGKFYDVDNVEAADYKQYRDPQFKENSDQQGVFGTRYLLRDTGTCLFFVFGLCFPFSQPRGHHWKFLLC